MMSWHCRLILKTRIDDIVSSMSETGIEYRAKASAPTYGLRTQYPELLGSFNEGGDDDDDSLQMGELMPLMMDGR
jgi:hypothetical protein